MKDNIDINDPSYWRKSRLTTMYSLSRSLNGIGIAICLLTLAIMFLAFVIGTK